MRICWSAPHPLQLPLGEGENRSLMLYFDRMQQEESGLPLMVCPFCGSSYVGAPRSIVERRGNAETVHVTCVTCRKAMVLAIERTPTRLKSAGIITDCSARDYERFYATGKVTLDDVIRVHQVLQR